MSLPMRLTAGFVLTIGLLWGMVVYLPEYFVITGGIPALIILGALLTLMNIFILPVLNIISFPLKLLATLITIIALNLFFLWLLTVFAARLDPKFVVLSVKGGIDGWLIVSTVLGLGHWVLKHTLHAAKE